MVQKNNKWNLSKEKGEELAHKYILEILHDSKNHRILMSDLIILLNQRTKHINLKHHSKKKPMSVYLRCVYGSFINFLDNFTMYGIMKDGANIVVILIDNQLTPKSLTQDIVREHKSWILLDDEEFILV